MKNISILGSTGSIGRSTLEVVASFPDRFRVSGLTAGSNIQMLAGQIQQFKPEVVAVSSKESYKEIKKIVGSKTPEILFGVEGISAVAKMADADIVVSSIMGAAGLLPTLAAIKAGKRIAIANKEPFVMAGAIMKTEAHRYGAEILPVDSEHNAVFQCIQNNDKKRVSKIILTASGGPFNGYTASDLEKVTPDEALRHPKWTMGKKITIDSATLMNKGLEVIEAHHLFDMSAENIEVLIHPQSIIHSIVEFVDGSCLGQMSNPDMKGPIAYALSYPDRLAHVVEPLDWKSLEDLTFNCPDTETFPSLALAYEALAAGGTMPAVLNAANEVAVQAFLDNMISFNKIPELIKIVLNSHKPGSGLSIESILDADDWARKKILKELVR
ncbi:MAG: 1-deoxy-D-xylulose-5-phosphate reductoisomerase [Dissulfurispiraceae bacterium]|jgi:1-deoxy-D-xylulose-5-phosphate reductoisomerase|nr:1-deoxy-D-xylulose-5-phosphate reductoisomerase [Dissulfurispiraceae bacterium]